MTAAEAVVEPWIPSDVSHREWAELSARAPQLTATMRRYLVQLSTFLAPRSVEAADNTLRQLAGWLTEHTDVTAVADITRSHFEDYKVWLAARPGTQARDPGEEHPTAAAADDPHLLRTAHRVGLARRTTPQPDPPRRHPTPPRTAAQVPRRP